MKLRDYLGETGIGTDEIIVRDYIWTDVTIDIEDALDCEFVRWKDDVSPILYVKA